MGLAVPSQTTWTVGQEVTAALMNSNVRDAVSFLISRPHFKGSIQTATALTTAVNVSYPVLEDNYSAWNATNNYWVVPAGCAGLYRVYVCFKWGSGGAASAPSFQVLKNGTKAYVSPNAASTSGFTGLQGQDLIRCVAGDQLAVQLAGAGFTTQAGGDEPGDNNLLLIEWAAQ